MNIKILPIYDDLRINLVSSIDMPRLICVFGTVLVLDSS